MVNYSFAFQPIVDVTQKEIIAYEALVRGLENQNAGTILSRFTGDALLHFDAEARIHATTLAKKLGIPCSLSLNLLPQSLDLLPHALEETLKHAMACDLEPERIVLEISETELISQPEGFSARIEKIQSAGVRFSFDDFGAGYSGLNLLAEFQPHTIKLDRILIQDIWSKGPRQAIVRGVLSTCRDLGIDVVAEGVEDLNEYDWLRNEGIELFQGYLFCKPEFEALPSASFPADAD